MQNKRHKLAESLTSLLYTGVEHNLGTFLNHSELAELSLTHKAANSTLKNQLNIRKVMLWCIRGEVKPLIAFVSQHPEYLFIKGDIEDHYTEQAYYQVSTFQLILFLGDWDLLKEITPFLKGQYLSHAHLQSLELLQGGADLVKLSFDPLTCPFSQLTVLQEHDLMLPLLENPDGILFFEDRLYYANQTQQSIQPLAATEDSGYQELLSSIKQMHPNSSCRSSDSQHQWLFTHYQIRLQRQGLRFKKNGQLYQDIKPSYQLIHQYRHHLHLLTAQANSEELTQNWILGVGQAQRVLPVHLMQRLCANDKFSPLRSVESFRIQRFIRRDMYDNKTLHRYHDIYPLQALGQSFALCKGSETRAYSQSKPTADTVWIDLQAFHRLFKISASFKLKWLDCLTEALNPETKIENPFSPLLVTVNCLQTQPPVVNFSVFLPPIILLKLTDYLQNKLGELASPVFEELLEKIIAEEGYFVNHVWPAIRRGVLRYTEMELGRYSSSEIDAVIATYRVKKEDIELFKALEKQSL